MIAQPSGDLHEVDAGVEDAAKERFAQHGLGERRRRRVRPRPRDICSRRNSASRSSAAVLSIAPLVMAWENVPSMKTKARSPSSSIDAT